LFSPFANDDSGEQRVNSLKKADGSLLDLFQSEFFTIHMLFKYLFKSQQEGVIEYLVHKLYHESAQNIDFYLP
jgi:hypothetical protein